MDPEIKKALEELRGLVGKNVDAFARLEKIEAAANAGSNDLKAMRGEIDGLKADIEKRDKELKEIRQASRERSMNADPIQERRKATETTGMIVRELLTRKIGCEMPSAYRGEVDVLKQYREQRATIQAGSGDGLNLIPTMTSTDIIDSLEEVSDILGLVDFMADLPGKVDIPVLTNRPQLKAKRTSIDSSLTQQDPGLGLLSFDPNEAGFLVPVDNRLIQMSAISLGRLITRLMTEGVAQGLADWLILADGTANYNSLTGIMNETNEAYIVSLAGGKKLFSDLDVAALRKVKANNLKRGRGVRARWLMSLDAYGLCEDFKREGQVPVVTYNNANGMGRVLTNEVVLEESMPDIADANQAGKAFLGFGDLATFFVGLVGGIQMATSDQYKFGENQTTFRAVLNLDIKRKPSRTFTVLKTAAAT